MSRYTLTWDDDAISELAELWMNAANPSAVASASDRIEAELVNDPGIKGREVSEGLRSISIWPIRVLFEVYPSDRKAKVLKVMLLE